MAGASVPPEVRQNTGSNQNVTLWAAEKPARGREGNSLLDLITNRASPTDVGLRPPSFENGKAKHIAKDEAESLSSDSNKSDCWVRHAELFIIQIAESTRWTVPN